jgi:hypothetical protein
MLSAPCAFPVTARRIAVSWLTAFVGLVLIGAAWALAMPYDAPPDEFQHVVRAYGVVDGQIISPDAMQRVPDSLNPPGIGCFRWHTEKTADCAATAGSVPGSEQRTSRDKTNAAFYSPAYYLICGWPIYLWPDYTGIILARLATAVFMAAFLASAFAVAAGLNRGRRLLTGLLIGISPVTLGLAGAVNPAGPEIAVGIALWVALIAMVEARRVNPWTVGLAGVSAAGLAVLRGFGLGWLFLIVCVAALGPGRGRLRPLLGNRLLWLGAAVTALGIGYGLYWRYAVPALSLDNGPRPSGALDGRQVVIQVLWDRLPYYAQGMVGLTSYGDVPQPQIYFYVWYIVAGCTVLLGLACLGWLSRVRLAAIVLGSFAILAVPDVNAIHHGWYLSQGRYALPFIVGAPLLAAYLLGESGVLDDHRLDQLTRLGALVLLPFQFVALWFTMVRFDKGVNPKVYPMAVNPYHGRWTPPEGVTLPLALCALGCAVVFGLFYWMTMSSGRLASSTPSITPAYRVPAGKY